MAQTQKAIAMNKTELFQKATHIACQNCHDRASVASFVITIVDHDDLEDDLTYDVWMELDGCTCGDPLLEAMIVTPSPLFGGTPIDEDRYMDDVAPNPFNHHGRAKGYEYTLDDQLFDELEEAGLIDG